jgi:signal transduction histidine kinase
MRAIYLRLTIVLIIFLIITTIGGYFIYSTYSELNTELIKRSSLILGQAVEDALKNVSDQNLETLTNNERRRLRSLMTSMASETGSIIHILLINKSMRILVSSDKSVEGRTYTSPEELENLTGDEPKVIPRAWNDSTKVLDVIIPIKNEQNEILSYLRLVLSHKELVSFYKDFSFVFLPFALISGLLLLFTFYFVSRSYMQPMESLKKAALQLQEGNFSKPIEYKSKDEFTDTFKILNDAMKKVGVLSEGYKKAEKRIANMLQVVDESIVLLDMSGAVISYNDAAKKLLHCSEGQQFPKYFEMLKAGSRELSDAINFSIKQDRAYKNHEITVWLPDGAHLQLRISTQVSKEMNQVTGVLCTFKDLHLLRDLENHLQRSMQFGVITNLASSISHEIKNPLSSLAMHTESLGNKLAALPIAEDERISKSLHVLKTEGKRIQRVLEKFLMLARPNPIDLKLIQLNSVIDDVLVLVQQQAIERNIELITELDPNLDFIYGDADQLKQVILNLILNAFQAIEKRGTVKIITRKEQRRIFVDVIDDGAGMPEDVQKKIFEYHYTTKEDGAGIGLAISKNIMQLHDGRISFESTFGKGTHFTLDFPKKDQTTQTNIPVVKRTK